MSNLSDAMTPSHLSLDVPEEARGAARLHLQVRGQLSCTPRCERQTRHLRQQSLLDLPVCQGLRVCQHHSTLLHTPHIHIHTHTHRTYTHKPKHSHTQTCIHKHTHRHALSCIDRYTLTVRGIHDLTTYNLIYPCFTWASMIHEAKRTSLPQDAIYLDWSLEQSHKCVG